VAADPNTYGIVKEQGKSEKLQELLGRRLQIADKFFHGVLWRLVFPFYNSKPNQTTIHTREIKDGGW
jgi:hypothetical protein